MNFHATMKHSGREQGVDGTLFITNPQETKTWEIEDEASFEIFLADLEELGLYKISFICSSSIDFPEEYTQDPKLLKAIEIIFHQCPQ